MTIPAFPDTTETLDAIRATIERPITINVKVQGTPCSACELDPITNTSVNSFCTVCSGLHWINTISGYTISGHVRWTRLEQPMYSPGGIIDQGDCIVTVKYSELTLTNIQNSDHFIVDERDLYLKNYVKKGVRQLNRIRIILKEDSQ